MSIVANNAAKPGWPVTKDNLITKQEIEDLKNAGCIVFIKPRLGIAVVNGFSRYMLPAGLKTK